MSNTGTSKRQRSSVRLPFAILKALLLTLLFAVILIFVASLLLIRHPDPLSLVPLVGAIVLGITSLLCGYFTAKFMKGAFPAGLFGGILFSSILFLSALAAGWLTFSPLSLLPFPASILLSGLGGLFGKRHRRRKSHH